MKPGSLLFVEGIDVFSFAHELPYRIELFGDEVESIRSFEPGSQLSVDAVSTINIIPDIQSRLIHEERQSFFEFIPATTRIWFKDFQLTADIIQKLFEKAGALFQQTVATSSTQVVLGPEKLFDDGTSFKQLVSAFKKLNFKRFVFETLLCSIGSLLLSPPSIKF